MMQLIKLMFFRLSNCNINAETEDKGPFLSVGKSSPIKNKVALILRSTNYVEFFIAKELLAVVQRCRKFGQILSAPNVG